jgi:hypothetical protein
MRGGGISLLELLVALDFVQRHMKQTFEPDALVRPIDVSRGGLREAAKAAVAREARSSNRLGSLVPRRHAT